MWRRATPVGGCTPGWSTVGAREAHGMRGAPLGPCLPPGPAPFPRAPRSTPPLVRRGGPGCARPLLLGPYGRLGRRPPGRSRCRARSHPESSPAPPRSAGRRVRRVSHCGQRSVIGAGLGVLLGAPAFSGAVAPFPRGAEGGHAARRRRRFRGRAARGALRIYLQVGVRARVLLWGVSFAASESQRPDDLVCCVQRRRSGACFVWGRGFRHSLVALPKSRGWGADFQWLVYVLWARRGVGRGARTLAPQAGVHVCVWALDAPPAVRVAWVTPLRGASEVRRSPSSSCPPPGGCRGLLSTCYGRGCAVMGAQRCPLGLLALWGLRAAGLVVGRPRGGVAYGCEGRLVSGAVPPPAARSPGRAAGVP